jgi:hypothetical protein
VKQLKIFIIKTVKMCINCDKSKISNNISIYRKLNFADIVDKVVIFSIILFIVTSSGRNIAELFFLLSTILLIFIRSLRSRLHIIIALIIFSLILCCSPIDIAFRKNNNNKFQLRILPIEVSSGMYQHIEIRKHRGEIENNDFIIYRYSAGIRFTHPKYALVVFWY